MERKLMGTRNSQVTGPYDANPSHPVESALDPAQSQERHQQELQFRAFASKVRLRRVLGALFGGAFLVLLWFTAITTRVGQFVDNIAMDSIRVRIDFTGTPSRLLAALTSETALISFGILIVAIALVRRRAQLALRVGLVFVFANLITQGLKELIVRPELEVGYSLTNSFPSGHVTVIASLAVALIAVVPLRARAFFCSVSFILTALVGVAVVSLGWHRLSDVLGAIVVVTVCGLLGLPSEWLRPPASGNLVALGVTSTFVFALASVGFVLLTLTVKDLSGEAVSAADIYDLSSTGVPGTLFAISSCLLIISAGGIMSTLIGSLAGRCSPRVPTI